MSGPPGREPIDRLMLFGRRHLSASFRDGFRRSAPARVLGFQRTKLFRAFSGTLSEAKKNSYQIRRVAGIALPFRIYLPVRPSLFQVGRQLRNCAQQPHVPANGTRKTEILRRNGASIAATDGPGTLQPHATCGRDPSSSAIRTSWLPSTSVTFISIRLGLSASTKKLIRRLRRSNELLISGKEPRGSIALHCKSNSYSS